MKKLFTLLLVVAMVLGIVSTAMAATTTTTPSKVAGAAFSDIAGNDAEANITLLKVEGIMKGDAGATTARPSDPISRVEFAAMIIRMLGKDGLAASLNSMKPNTKDEIPAWGWGYVNLAQSMGIMVGDPDGKFRPLDNVTFAESLAMLERGIGQDKKAVGAWPTNYMVVAYDLELNDGVDAYANTPATRGDVAIMMVNTMKTDKLLAIKDDGTESYGTPILWDGTDNDYAKEGTANVYNDVVSSIDAANNSISLAEAGAVDLAKTVNLVGAKTFDELLNQPVKCVAIDDEIAYIEITEDANVITGTFDDITTNDDDEPIITVDDKDYVLATKTVGEDTYIATTFRLNGTKLTGWDQLDAQDVSYTDTDSVVLNISDDEVVNVDATRVTYKDRVVTDVYEVEDSEGDYVLDLNDVADLTLDDKTPVTIDGVAKTIADIDDDDVVYVTTDFKADGTAKASVQKVEAFRATVKGVVDSVKNAASGKSVTLELADGSTKTYKFSSNYTTLPSLNATVEYRLNKDGKVRFLVDSSSTANVGYVTDISIVDGDTYQVELDVAGTVKTFEFDGGDYSEIGGDAYINTAKVGDFITYNVLANGDLDAAAKITAIAGTVDAVDAANDVAVIDGHVVDVTVVYQQDGDDYVVASMSDLEKDLDVTYDETSGLVIIPE